MRKWENYGEWEWGETVLGAILVLGVLEVFLIQKSSWISLITPDGEARGKKCADWNWLPETGGNLFIAESILVWGGGTLTASQRLQNWKQTNLQWQYHELA